MYKKFIVELSKHKDDIDSVICEFDIQKDNLSQSWAKEINNNYPFYEQDRFTYWPNNGKDEEHFAKKLNEQIDIINKTYPGRVTLKASPDMDQQTMNEMHVFFERLRGPIESPLEWYLNATDDVKKAIERLNLLVHEYEYKQLNKELEKLTEHPNAMIVGTYEPKPRFKLTNDEYKLFTYRYTFGTVYINYCVVGKPILDVFLNQDEDIGNDNIRPQDHWSADWMIKFGAALPEWKVTEMEKDFWKWFESKEDFFNNLGILRGPKMSLGQIPVAQLNRECLLCYGLSNLEIVNKLSPYQYLKSTRVE